MDLCFILFLSIMCSYRVCWVFLASLFLFLMLFSASHILHTKRILISIDLFIVIERNYIRLFTWLCAYYSSYCFSWVPSTMAPGIEVICMPTTLF